MLTNQDYVIFFVIQLAMVAFAYSEAVLEGDTGWARNRKVWRFRIMRGYDYTSYHLAAYYVMFPLLILILPIAIVGFSWHLFWVLFVAYLFGTVLEDFMWFVLNPHYEFKRWNPHETTWYPWLTIGRFYIPWSYVIKLSLVVMIFVAIHS